MKLDRQTDRQSFYIDHGRRTSLRLVLIIFLASAFPLKRNISHFCSELVSRINPKCRRPHIIIYEVWNCWKFFKIYFWVKQTSKFYWRNPSETHSYFKANNFPPEFEHKASTHAAAMLTYSVATTDSNISYSNINHTMYFHILDKIFKPIQKDRKRNPIQNSVISTAMPFSQIASVEY